MLPLRYLLGQLLEIIFTFCTVKVDCDPLAPPAEADDPAPAPLLALPAAPPPASEPVIRT
jgi:hypothetical protein